MATANCKSCNKAIEPWTRRRDTEYCSNACKQRDYRQRKRAQRKAVREAFFARRSKPVTDGAIARDVTRRSSAAAIAAAAPRPATPTTYVSSKPFKKAIVAKGGRS